MERNDFGFTSGSSTKPQKVGAGDGNTYIVDERALRAENDRLTRQLAEAQAEIERLRTRADTAEAELAALKGAKVSPLEFAETNNRPPTYDTGITKLGRWRVTYSDDRWMAIWGHGVIIALRNTMAEAFAAAQADYTARILSALTTEPGWKDMASAPKDGTAILTYSKGCDGNESHMVMWWTSDKTERCGSGWEAYAVSHRLDPDLWMPLPLPPEEQEG